jgi:hypothetical protein
VKAFAKDKRIQYQVAVNITFSVCEKAQFENLSHAACGILVSQQ